MNIKFLAPLFTPSIRFSLRPGSWLRRLNLMKEAKQSIEEIKKSLIILFSCAIYVCIWGRKVLH